MWLDFGGVINYKYSSQVLEVFDKIINRYRDDNINQVRRFLLITPFRVVIATTHVIAASFAV